ncbi:MAG: reverse transcriptase family protein [Flavobacteriaceae bacterium]|nr:reverse transcriptase family protein [Flavobacteriaceae bacterium]
MKKTSTKDKIKIREKFLRIENLEDLSQLLNECNELIYRNSNYTINKKSLDYFIHPKTSKNRYKSFTVNKKSGGTRTIHAPVKRLKYILKSVNFLLQCISNSHPAANGFVNEKSVVTNAKKHVGKRYVYNIDLKDFFYSFDRNRVKMGLMYNLGLGKKNENLAFKIASLCTHPFEIDGEVKTVLPQGSPTSPTLTNILCKKLDRRLNGLANRFGATYTRYADDITFSSDHNIYQKPKNEQLNNNGCFDNFIAELSRIIKVEELQINPKKTRLQKNGYHQSVTGLSVNEKVNVHPRYIQQLKMWLYYWERYGYEKAEQIFRRDYKADKGHVKKADAKLMHVLDGKLEFLKMVKGAEGMTYKKLNARFSKLVSKSSPINKTLSVWEKEGIEKAMAFYQNETKVDKKTRYDKKNHELIISL